MMAKPALPRKESWLSSLLSGYRSRKADLYPKGANSSGDYSKGGSC